MRDYLAVVGVLTWGMIMFTMAMLLIRSAERGRAEDAKRREAEAAHPPTSAPESR